MKYLGAITNNYDLVTKKYVDDSDNKVISRGEQLVVNGSGMLGTNTNWSNWIFDGSHANSSAGSFTRSSTSYANIVSDEFFPVNANEKYKFEFDLISENNIGTMYAYLSFYDVDKISISAATTMYYSGTLTTLARELKAGDTKVYLTDASAYRTYGTGTHLRALIFWDYKNSFGYQYPPETYSRYILMPAWADDSSIDKTNNIITLTTPYTGVTHSAGTYVSQGCSGSTYKYSGIWGEKVPTEWKHYTGYFDGVDYSGLNKSAKFPPGTAYCKVGFLWNYNSANDHFWLTNVSVKEVPKEAINSDKVNSHTVNADVPTNAKFTDTVTTATTTGSGNAVTAISASNGALTVTKGSTFLTSYTETDPVFTASAAHGISSSDISSWNGKSTVSLNRKTTTGTNIADITINGTTTQLYAPTGGGGSGTITKVKTTAGAHTAIDVSSGAASFNVPTKTSHLTNDSGFTTNTGTITGVTAGTGLSGGGTSGSVTLNHTLSVPAGTASSTTIPTDGPTVKVPYVKYDGNGHIESWGERDHTVTGFSTATNMVNDGTGVRSNGDITDSSGNILSNMIEGTAEGNSDRTMTIGGYRLQYGTKSINPSSGTSGSGTWASPYRKDSSSITLNGFSVAPFVWLQVTGTWTGPNIAYPIDVTASSFKIRLISASTSDADRTIRWLAIARI